MDDMMKKMILFVSLFFIACASKSDEQIRSEIQRQVLMYAQKVKFKQDGENGVFVLSYLNPALKDEKKEDIFVLSVSPKESKIEHLRAFMDVNEAVIAPLSPEDELKKYLINSDFVEYYKFAFPFKDTAVLTVRLCLSLDCFELNFQKYSKSMYYRSTDVDTQYN